MIEKTSEAGATQPLVAVKAKDVCPVPRCGLKTSKRSPYKLCLVHNNWMEFFLWSLNNITITQTPTPTIKPSPLILPGWGKSP